MQLNNKNFIFLNLFQVKSTSFLWISFLIISFSLTLNLKQAVAQPNPLVPAEGGKGGGGGSDTTQNTSDGINRYTPQELDEIREVKNIWKSDLNEENVEESNKLMVNYDSLYYVYAGIRKSNSIEKNNYTYRIYPNFLLPKIYGTDSTIFKYTVTSNKYYSKLKIDNEVLNNQLQANIQKIDNMVDNYKYKSADVFNNLLPPVVLIDGHVMKPKEYQTFITDFFSANPELIYYCSKRFVKLIEIGDYNKLMKLHNSSANALDYREESRNASKTKINK